MQYSIFRPLLPLVAAFLLCLTSELSAQLPYKLTPSHDTTIIIHGAGTFNKLIVDNTQNDKDVNLVIETIYTCPYPNDGAFFGIQSRLIDGHINPTYNLHVAAHTTSENWNLYPEQPDIILLKDANCMAYGAFDAEVDVKDSDKILLREFLHSDIPIYLSANGIMSIISQVKEGTTECVPVFFTAYSAGETIQSVENYFSDSLYSFQNPLALPYTTSAGDSAIKLFDVCYSPHAGEPTSYSRRLTVNTDKGNYSLLIAGAPCGGAASPSVWQNILEGVLDRSQPGSINVYPNPSPNAFTITSSLLHNHIDILDILGHSIVSEEMGSSFVWDGKLSSGNRALSGIYFIKVKGTNQAGEVITETKKVLLTD